MNALTSKPATFEKSVSLRNQKIWDSLTDIKVGQAIEVWLDTLKKPTRKTYKTSMDMLCKKGFLFPKMSLQEFGVLLHEPIIDSIKNAPYWAEATKQARCGAYISFTCFLSRRSGAILKRAVPSREGVSKTFRKIRERCKTEALTMGQWNKMIERLEVRSLRDATICRLILNGGKRVSEVLSLNFSQINEDNREITYIQSKSAYHKEICITYPAYIFTDIFKLNPSREGLVFITRQGKPVSHHHIYKSFIRAGEEAKIPIRTTPHTLRASCITYLRAQAYSDADIMKITGHSSSTSVNMYDKTSQKNNVSKLITLI